MSEDCPSAILAGVGVALKLVQVLGSRLGFPHLWRSYTDFATLGTVADLMPMRDENRALVADGLARMNTNPRPCIAALLATTGQAGKPLSATNLSFSLIPRLNAAGRMGNADLALDLLMCDNYGECCAMAEALEDVNNQRRAIEAELSDIAKEQAGRIYHGQRALVVAGEGWHEGVKGIVASRLVNTYGVPALLFTIDGDEARGSGRSVGNVNLFEAVESISYLTKRFGGHGAAVGVTIPTKNLKAFAQRLDAYMQKLPEAAFHPLTEVDALVSLDELTLESVALVERLAPFGQENPQPTFLARNVTLVNTRAVGQTKDHFACTLTNGRASVAGIMFHCAAIDALLVDIGKVISTALASTGVAEQNEVSGSRQDLHLVKEHRAVAQAGPAMDGQNGWVFFAGNVGHRREYPPLDRQRTSGIHLQRLGRGDGAAVIDPVVGVGQTDLPAMPQSVDLSDPVFPKRQVHQPVCRGIQILHTARPGEGAGLAGGQIQSLNPAVPVHGGEEIERVSADAPGLSGTKAAVGGHGVAHTMMAVAEEQLWFSSGERDGVEIAIFPISIAKPVGKTENRLVPPKGKELHQIPVLFQEAPGLPTGRVPDKNTVAQSLDIREAMTGIEDPAIFHGKACNLEGRRGEGGGYAGRRVVDIQLGPLPAGEAQAVGPEGNVLQHIIGAVFVFLQGRSFLRGTQTVQIWAVHVHGGGENEPPVR